MDKKAVLRSLNFGSDVAEHEAAQLAKYFVETDQWERIFQGSVDIIYGAKGSGKSAIYHLLISKQDALFDRNILVVSAENPDEDPAFNEIKADLPPSEDEFVGLWKLYLCSVAAVRARDAGIRNKEMSDVLEYLAELELLSPSLSLNTIVKNISDYVRRVFRPRDISATTNFDPVSGGVTSMTGKISFSEPGIDGRRKGVRPIREVLLELNSALAKSGYTVWLLLDRLDVAFAGKIEVENRALRALFDAYKDLARLSHLKLKLFIRSDIWDRITESGYREATHVGSPLTSTKLEWDQNQLFNVFMKRLVQSTELCDAYKVERDKVISYITLQELLIERVFPDKVDVGKNPRTFAWIHGRLQDGSKRATPRELIQFCAALRAIQLQRTERAVPLPAGEVLFERSTFKEALKPVSSDRLIKTVYAEYASLKPWLEVLRGHKSFQSTDTLGMLWGISSTEAHMRADLLSKAGVFHRYERSGLVLYEIPYLYRPALEVVRGSENGLWQDIKRPVDDPELDFGEGEDT